MPGKDLAGAELAHLDVHPLVHLGVRPRLKCSSTLGELRRETVDVSRNWLQLRAAVGNVNVLAQGEFDGPAALFGNGECRPDGLGNGLVLDSDLGERLIHGSGNDLELSEGIPALGEGVADLPKFALRSGRDERLERLEPMAGRMVKILLAEHVAIGAPDCRERLLWVGELLGEPAGRLPERGPGFRACSGQTPFRKRTLAKPPCFVAFSPAAIAKSEHGLEGGR